MLSYYVYYKVPRENADRANYAIYRLLHDIEVATGVHGRLLRRRDDETTWMEVYEDVRDAAALEGALDALVRRHGIEALLVPGSTRHLEVFR